MKNFTLEMARRLAFVVGSILVAGYLIYRGNTLSPKLSVDPTLAVMMILTGVMVLMTGLAAALRGPEEEA